MNIEVGGQMYSAAVVVGTRENGGLQLYGFVRMTKKRCSVPASAKAPHTVAMLHPFLVSM